MAEKTLEELVLEIATEFTVEKLVQGTDNKAPDYFQDARTDFEHAIALISDMNHTSFAPLPIQAKVQLAKIAAQVRIRCNEVVNFRHDAGGDPSENKKRILKEFRDAYKNLLDATAPHLGYLRLRTVDDLNKTIEEVKSAKTEVDGLVQNAKDAVAKAWVGAYSGQFDKSSKEHEIASWWWM